MSLIAKQIQFISKHQKLENQTKNPFLLISLKYAYETKSISRKFNSSLRNLNKEYVKELIRNILNRTRNIQNKIKNMV